MTPEQIDAIAKPIVMLAFIGAFLWVLSAIIKKMNF